MKKIKSIFCWKQTSIRSAAGVMIAMVFTSRVLGLVRDRMLAARFDPETLGVYFAAFRIPNFIFEILVMGALTSAFIPVFTKYMSSQESKDDIWRMSSTLIHMCVIFFIVLSVPLLLYTDTISHLIAPGFTQLQITQMSSFTRFMILFQILPLLVGNFFTGILQSHNLFFAPAVAPVLYNIGIITGIFLFTASLGIWAPVVGIGFGAVLFVLIQIPSLIVVGYHHYPRLQIRDKGVKEVWKIMIPRTLGLAISQIDTTVDLVLSTLLGASMVTVFNFAQHLQQFPIGLFGATVGQAAFPVMSQASARTDEAMLKKTIISAMNQILFFIFPISALFIVLRVPIVRLVFGASRFNWEATVLTGMTVSAFSISLFAQSLSHVFTRAFYALYDSKTPVIVGVITILINASLSIFFVVVLKWPIWSLGLSTSFSSIVNIFILYFLLDYQKHVLTIKDIGKGPVKMAVAALIMGGALYVPLKLFDQLIFDTTRISGLVFLTGTAGAIGLACYLFLVWVFGVPEVKTFMKILDSVRKPKQVLLEPATEIINNGTQESSVG